MYLCYSVHNGSFGWFEDFLVITDFQEIDYVVYWYVFKILFLLGGWWVLESVILWFSTNLEKFQPFFTYLFCLPSSPFWDSHAMQNCLLISHLTEALFIFSISVLYFQYLLTALSVKTDLFFPVSNMLIPSVYFSFW